MTIIFASFPLRQQKSLAFTPTVPTVNSIFKKLSMSQHDRHESFCTIMRDRHQHSSYTTNVTGQHSQPYDHKLSSNVYSSTREYVYMPLL
jgi:hypothetical protein